MIYLGGKARLAKYIVPIIQHYLSLDEDSTYWEPFVGGGNIIQHITSPKIRYGSDSNPRTIEALRLIRDNLNLIPKDNTEFTEQNYKEVKQDPSHPLYAFAGFAYSYGAKWWGGWQRGSGRDYVKTAYNSALKQNKLLQGVNLFCCDCYSIGVKRNKRLIIYCDPPYINTTGYKGTGKFDHASFYDWCRYMKTRGHTILLSEQTAPSDFESLWKKERRTTFKQGESKVVNEQLFILE